MTVWSKTEAKFVSFGSWNIFDLKNIVRVRTDFAYEVLTGVVWNFSFVLTWYILLVRVDPVVQRPQNVAPPAEGARAGGELGPDPAGEGADTARTSRCQACFSEITSIEILLNTFAWIIFLLTKIDFPLLKVNSLRFIRFIVCGKIFAHNFPNPV